MFTKCLYIKKLNYGENDVSLADTYKNIGSIYLDQGALEEALEMYTKCLNIQKLHYGENNINLADIYLNLSVLLEEMADYNLSL